MEDQNPDIGGINNNDIDEDNNHSEPRSEDDYDNDYDENDGESLQLESSVVLYKKFNFPKCIKIDKSFFDKNGEYTYDSDEYSKYCENNNMTRYYVYYYYVYYNRYDKPTPQDRNTTCRKLSKDSNCELLKAA